MPNLVSFEWSIFEDEVFIGNRQVDGEKFSNF